MSRFDEEPDGDIHGECAREIHRLEAENAKLQRTCDALDVIIQNFKAAPPYTESNCKEILDRWIPCIERLPEIATPVLALVGKNTYALARVEYDEGWLWSIGGSDLSDVRNYEADDDYQPTHWMPLPAAPKGK